MANDQLPNIPFSILDLALIKKGQTPADAIENSRDLARHAEDFGYTRFWMAEHHNMENIASSATSVLIGHVAEATNTLRVGSGGIMLPNHSPLIIAEQFGTLATMYPDRIDLGLGRAPGTDQQTAQAIRPDRINAVRNFPDNVKRLRRYFSEEGSPDGIQAIPGKGTQVPLWILGSSTDSAHLAAALGLPYVFASHFAPQQLDAAARIYREHFSPSKQLEEPYFMPCINMVTAETDQQAEYLATSLKKMMQGVVTGERKPVPPPVDDLDSVWTMQERAAVRQMLSCSFFGSPSTIAEQLGEFLERTKADEIMIASYVYDHQQRIDSHRLFAELMQSNAAVTHQQQES